MKKISAFLALLFAVVTSPAFATCNSPIGVKDAGGTTNNFNSVYADLAANCNAVFAPSSVINTLTGWTTATALNSTQTVLATPHGAPALLLQLDQTSTLTVGAITIEGTYDGTNWGTIPVAQILNPNTFANLTNPYTLVASTNQPFLVLSQGYQGIRIKLSTAITGTATVTPFVTLLAYNPVLGALLNPLAAGSAIIGKVGIDQTTPGTTNAVQAIPGTTGGLTNFFLQPTASDNHANIKNGAGQVYHVSVTNNSATINYLRLYNAASGFNGCNSATNIVTQWAIPASTSGAGIVVPIDGAGIAFSTGISICVTSGYATTDTTNATASAMSVNVGYK